MKPTCIRIRSAQEIKNALDRCKKLIVSISDQRKVNNSMRLQVYQDLLMRIHNNLYTISIVNINEKTATSLNLIYRSVIVDVYWLLYFAYIDENLFIQVCESLNIDHVKFNKFHAECVFRLYNDIGKIEPEESIQLLLDKLYDHFKDTLDCIKGEPWIIKGQTNRFTIKSIYDYFKDNHNGAFYWLYLSFRLLSQTEHYAPISKTFAFPNCDERDRQYLLFNGFINHALNDFKSKLS